MLFYFSASVFDTRLYKSRFVSLISKFLYCSNSYYIIYFVKIKFFLKFNKSLKLFVNFLIFGKFIISCSILTASDILSSIDESVNPCDDFYQFSCANWIKSTTIPEEIGFVNIFTQSSQRLEIELKCKQFKDQNSCHR